MIVPKPATKKLLAAASGEYHDQLIRDQRALTYLVEERRISREAVDFFSLGIARNPIDGHENFRGRISFPYFTATGITTIRFRYLGDHKRDNAKKFLSITGDVARLYNAPALMKASRIALCEGETDTIACWMAGIPAVGLPGATSWKANFSRIFRNREVLVLADNDDSGEGQRFAEGIYKSLEGCDIILMPKGHDVSSFTAEHGISALRAKVGL